MDEEYFGPDERVPPPETIDELETWMIESSCKALLVKNSRRNNEFQELREVDGRFELIHHGDRARTVERTFELEADAVLYAYESLRRNPRSCSLHVGSFEDNRHADALLDEIQDLGLACYQDKIPYGGPDAPLFRVWIHGRDRAAVTELRERYKAHSFKPESDRW